MDDRSDDDLRRCIRDGDPPERVLAAFELGRRLGAAVTPELHLRDEPNSGVRRHWLTVLASFGERDAVRVVAERHAGDEEGEHALHLALQLGIGDADWWTDRFLATTPSMQAVLLERGDVRWAAVGPVLERLLGDDISEVRRLAARRLLDVQGSPGPALRTYAGARPSEAGDVLDAWATGPDHRALVDVLPLSDGRVDVGLRALLDAERAYDLADVRARVVAYPEAFALVRSPAGRRLLFDVTDEQLARRWYVSEPWLAELARSAGPPWDEDERKMAERWARDASSSTDDWDEPVQAPVLRAIRWPGAPSSEGQGPIST